MIDQYDVIVIGAGVGCMLTRAFSRYQLHMLLIDKEADIGMGASSANSAIVHAGYDPMPGTLKAKMNVAGNPMWDQLSGELDFAFERRGDYVVAIGPRSCPRWTDCWSRAQATACRACTSSPARRCATRAEHQPAGQRRAVGAHRRDLRSLRGDRAPRLKTRSRTARDPHRDRLRGLHPRG